MCQDRFDAQNRQVKKGKMSDTMKLKKTIFTLSMFFVTGVAMWAETPALNDAKRWKPMASVPMKISFDKNENALVFSTIKLNNKVGYNYFPIWSRSKNETLSAVKSVSFKFKVIAISPAIAGPNGKVIMPDLPGMNFTVNTNTTEWQTVTVMLPKTEKTIKEFNFMQIMFSVPRSGDVKFLLKDLTFLDASGNELKEIRR